MNEPPAYEAGGSLRFFQERFSAPGVPANAE